MVMNHEQQMLDVVALGEGVQDFQYQRHQGQQEEKRGRDVVQ